MDKDVNNIILPTFDEWYKAKTGQTFDEQWMRGGMPIWPAMKALSIAMRDYVTEMARLAATPHSKDDMETPAQQAARRLGYESFNYTERS